MKAREATLFSSNSDSLANEPMTTQKHAGSAELYAWTGMLLFAAVLPIKLSWGYAALIPVLLYWLTTNLYKKQSLSNLLHDPFITPLLFWFSTTVCSALFGLHPYRSISQLLPLMCWALLIAVTKDLSQRNNPLHLLYALIFGQSLAALHSVIEPILPQKLLWFPVGAVTESGQLALVIPVAIGALLHLSQKSQPKISKAFLVITSLSLMSLFCAASFMSRMDAATLSTPLAIAVFLTILLLACVINARGKSHKTIYFILFIALPLLAAAMLVNLKRGPWMGLAIAIALLLSRFRFRYVVTLVTVLILGAVSITPIRDRLSESYSNFVIAGGRQVMWEIGLELSAKYPLGIGYQNGEIMRQLDPDIPANFDHFHNNFLTVLVETGWVGLAAFLWWIFSLLKYSIAAPLTNQRGLLINALGAGLLAWQVAGLVEFNFGDSEVVLIAFMIIGVIAALRERVKFELV